MLRLKQINVKDGEQRQHIAIQVRNEIYGVSVMDVSTHFGVVLLGLGEPRVVNSRIVFERNFSTKDSYVLVSLDGVSYGVKSTYRTTADDIVDAGSLVLNCDLYQAQN